jgi:hypothetical protein
MSPDQARRLVEDYGLTKDNGDSSGVSPVTHESPESPAEVQEMHTNINRFMAHIGVR